MTTNPLLQIFNTPPANTDNKGKLFVTFFAGRRVQKMRHTLLARRDPPSGGAKVPGKVPGGRRVTLPPFITRPLSVRHNRHVGLLNAIVTGTLQFYLNL